jgi:crotonobetainyl-CoA:carnitine CoA-transferase CaiB-like acyl-CoA transferase
VTNALRYQHLTALTEILNVAFARCTTEQLAKRFKDAGVMHSPVNDYLEFLRQPQLEVTGAIAWLEQPGVGRVPVPNVPGLVPLVSGATRAVAPSLDQHRAEILAELGLAT